MTAFRPAGPASDEGEQDAPEPAPLRRLRWLVTALIVVLIIGMITVSAALVIRLGSFGAAGGGGLPGPVSAGAIRLPAGVEIGAVGRSGRDILVVTRGPGGAEHLRLFDGATGRELSATPILRD